MTEQYMIMMHEKPIILPKAALEGTMINRFLSNTDSTKAQTKHSKMKNSMTKVQINTKRDLCGRYLITNTRYAMIMAVLKVACRTGHEGMKATIQETNVMRERSKTKKKRWIGCSYLYTEYKIAFWIRNSFLRA